MDQQTDWTFSQKVQIMQAWLHDAYKGSVEDKLFASKIALQVIEELLGSQPDLLTRDVAESVVDGISHTKGLVMQFEEEENDEVHVTLDPTQEVWAMGSIHFVPRGLDLESIHKGKVKSRNVHTSALLKQKLADHWIVLNQNGNRILFLNPEQIRRDGNEVTVVGKLILIGGVRGVDFRGGGQVPRSFFPYWFTEGETAIMVSRVELLAEGNFLETVSFYPHVEEKVK